MSKLRFIFGAVVACMLAMNASAQTDYVMLGKFKAHPTRILAKYSNTLAVQPSVAAFRTLGLRITKQIPLVPGLVIFDTVPLAVQAVAPAPNPVDQAASLLGRIAALRSTGLFEYVEPDYMGEPLKTPNDARFGDGTLWGLRNIGTGGGVQGADINATAAWDVTTGSNNVIVAVIDTGIRYTHTDLATNMWRNKVEIAGNAIDDDGNGYVDDVFGINTLIPGNGNPMDDNGHGTHIAGTIGAGANDGFPHVGINWNIQIMALKFVSADGTQLPTSGAIECIAYAVTNKAKAINASWSVRFSQSLFDSVAAARSQGVLFVAAAGNGRTTSGTGDNDAVPLYPANFQLDSVLSVAALDRADQLADFSNYGRTSVHLGAPGVSIYSTWFSSDRSYGLSDGTSMAAPHVVGVAGLIMAQFPNATLTEVRERIMLTTVPIPALSGITISGGRLNANNALRAVADGSLHLSIDPPSGSVLLSATNQLMFVTVSDLVSIPNATVTGLTGLGTTINFLNTGVAPDAFAGDAIYSANYAVPTNLGPHIITIVATAPGKRSATNTVTYTITPRPTNDPFDAPAKIASVGGVVSANNKLASLELDEPFHAGLLADKSLWWVWSPSSNTRAFLDTAGSTFDTVIAVYTGTDVAHLTPIASVDDVPLSRQGYLFFNATGGVTYHIAVASASSDESGTIQLRVEPGGVPDTNAPIVNITSPASGTVTPNSSITLFGTAFDPVPNASGLVDVRYRVNGASIGSLATGTTNWTATVALSPGDNVIQVNAIDKAGNVSLTRTITVNHATFAGNDAFVAGVPLANAVFPVSTSQATKELGEPNHAGNEGGKSIWYSFTPASDGYLFLSTTNNTFDTLLAVYTGNRLDTLTVVGSNDDAADGVSASKLTIAVRAGQTYRIAVDGFAGAFGSFSLLNSFAPATVYTVTIPTNIIGGSVSLGANDFVSNSVVTVMATPQQYYDFAGFRNDSVNTPATTFSFTISNNVTLAPVFVPHPFTEDFEVGSFARNPWRFSGPLWVMQTNTTASGRYAASSGVTADNQSSILSLQVFTRAGIGAFNYRVSSEDGWDWLEFYLNGTRLERWSGDSGWQQFQFSIPSGTNNLEWRYVKDIKEKAGLDAAFLDNLDLPTVASRPAVSFGTTADGQFQLRLSGDVNRQYIIQASSDLMTWSNISTNTAVNGQVRFTDPEFTGRSVRFFRAISP